ncbi:MAG: sigma-70 family RNA polymerase sigma factor [Planctomycetota bacterium]
MNSVLDDLMAQRTWVESLCTSLVRDRADAQDLAQETMLSGLLRKTPLLRPRAWLRRVAENHARQQHRSRSRTAAREREVAATNSDATTCPVEVNAAFEVQRQVAAAVDGLPEPFRTTVLLHHFEGLTLAAIAKQQQQPEGTVRWRLFRAHELLRERLHKVYGEDWRTAILPLCATGVRTTGAALLFAAVLLLAVGGAFWFGSDRAATAAEAAQAGPASRGASGTEVGESLAADLARTNADVPAANDAGAVPSAAVAPEPQSAVVRARIVDDLGVAIDGAVLRFERLLLDNLELSSPAQSLLMPDALTSADGVASLRLRTDDRLLGEMPSSMRPARGEPWRLSFSASAKGFLPATREAFVADGDDNHLGEVRLQRASTLRGRVLTRDGSLISGAQVGVFGTPLPLHYLERDAGEIDLRSAIATAETAMLFSRGSYELTPAPRGPVMLVAIADGYRSAPCFVHVLGAEQDVPDIVLDEAPSVGPAVRLRVQVVDPDGAPVARAFVRRQHQNGSASSATDENGMVQFGVSIRNGIADRAPSTLVACDLAGRLQPAIVKDVVADGELVTITLAKGRSVDVVVRAPASATSALRAEWVAEDSDVGSMGLPSDGNRFRFVPPPFAARLRVLQERCVPFESQPFASTEWPERLEIELAERTALLGSVTANGIAVEGAHVLALSRGKQVLRSGYRTGEWNATGTFDSRSGANGEFAIVGETKGEIRLLVQKAGFAPTVTDPIDFDPAVALRVPPIELGLGGSIRGRLRSTNGIAVARAVVAINHELFGPRTVLTDRNGRFAFEHVSAGGYEVRPGEKLMANGYIESSLGAARQRPFPVDAIVRDGAVTEVDLVSDACQLDLQIAAVGAWRGEGGLAGWTVELRCDADDRAVCGPQSVPADGKVRLVAHRAGAHSVVLRSPGGPFGDVRVTANVELAVGRSERAMAIELAPCRVPFEVGGGTDSVQLIAEADGMETIATAKVDADGRVLSAVLAPVGDVAVVAKGAVVGRVDTRTPR